MMPLWQVATAIFKLRPRPLTPVFDETTTNYHLKVSDFQNIMVIFMIWVITRGVFGPGLR
jgi:hypothetical protein